MWRGMVLGSNDNGVEVKLTGEASSEQPYFTRIGMGPLELPDSTQPTRLFETFTDLGLAALGSQLGRYPEVIASNGLWHRAAVLHVDWYNARHEESL